MTDLDDTEREAINDDAAGAYRLHVEQEGYHRDGFSAFTSGYRKGRSYQRARIGELQVEVRRIMEERTNANVRWTAGEARVEELEGALREADEALRRARDGLDFGLGHARRMEQDESPIPEKPMSRQMDNYLKDARRAHERVRTALRGGKDG